MVVIHAIMIISGVLVVVATTMGFLSAREPAARPHAHGH
jgi:hypothetical protein